MEKTSKKSRFSIKLYKDTVQEICGHFLKGIDKLAIPVNTGIMSVFTSTAYPVLVSDKGHVFGAVTQYGKGRIVVLTHRHFFATILKQSQDEVLEKLRQNIVQWVSTGEVTEHKDIRHKVLALENLDSLRQIQSTAAVKVLVWHGGNNVSSPRLLEDLTQFVQSGGGLVYGVCIKDFLKDKGEGSVVSDLPFYSLLEDAGVALFNKRIRDSERSDIIITDIKKYAETCSNVSTKILFSKPEIFLASPKSACDTIIKLQDQSKMKKMLNADLDQLYQELQNKLKQPTADKSVKGDVPAAILALSDYLSREGVAKYKRNPACEHFPGAITASCNVYRVQLQIKSTVPGIYPTGFYVPAGQAIKCTMVDQTNEWKVRIGAHSDKLNAFRYAIKRFPSIDVQKYLDKESVDVHTPYGGLLYLECTVPQSRLTITIDNLYRAPYYDLRDEMLPQEWPIQCSLAPPWADICSHFVIFTVPSDSVRNLLDPIEILRGWDKAVACMHHLKGTNIKDTGRQWIVTDIQPARGKMHAGQPIVLPLDFSKEDNSNYLFTTQIFTTGQWEVYHLLAENLADAHWSMQGKLADAIYDIFTLYAIETVGEQTAWLHPYLASYLDKAKEILSTSGSQPFYELVKDARLALLLFAQLMHQFGWGFYQKLFRQYLNLPDIEQPKTDSEKMAQFIQRSSHITGMNLAPLFTFWGFDIPESVISSTEFLPAFLPQDEITELVPERVKNVVTKYSAVARQPKAAVEQVEFGVTPMGATEMFIEELICTEEREPKTLESTLNNEEGCSNPLPI